MDGAVVVANKNLNKIIEKTTDTYKDWHEKLPFALHAYRTMVQTSTRVIPFSLVYGMEVVLPIEVEIPSLKVLMETKLREVEWFEIGTSNWIWLSESGYQLYAMAIYAKKEWCQLIIRRFNPNRSKKVT